VGNKPIIEHGIDHFSFFGIDNLFITTNYLSDQLQAFATDKKSSDLEIQTVNEPKFMGTIGAVKLIDTFRNDAILISNSDLLTNVDLELFYLAFIRSEADCCVLSVPYQVEVPFGVLQVENELLIDITEKPTYSYNTNGGMYIVRKEHLKMIPTNETFSAVDFVELLLKEKKKVTLYKHYGYWLDIGNHHDYLRAQHDIQFINQIN
jgi:NDP-sugar pyrophosphorylase family protein